MKHFKRIVADGYDAIAPRYLAWSGLDPSPERMRALAHLLALLPDGANVLELGCGAGVPVTQALAAKCRVIGVDISATQLALAHQRVPTATLIHVDMAALALAPASFDAVVSFYALTHVPRDEHAALLRRVYSWLRPSGLLFVTMGAGDSDDVVEQDWLGAPMFWSHFDAATNRALVEQAGFALVSADVVEEDEDGIPVRFLWVTAKTMS